MQSRKAERGGPPAWASGEELTNPQHKKSASDEMSNMAPEFD